MSDRFAYLNVYDSPVEYDSDSTYDGFVFAASGDTGVSAYVQAVNSMFRTGHPLIEEFVLNGTMGLCFVTEEERMSGVLASRYLDRLKTAYCRTSDLADAKAGDAFCLYDQVRYIQGMQASMVGTTTVVLSDTVAILVHSTGTYPVFSQENTEYYSNMQDAGYETRAARVVQLSNTLPHENRVVSNDIVIVDGGTYTVGSPITRNKWFNLVPLRETD